MYRALSMMGVPGVTQTVLATDAVQTLGTVAPPLTNRTLVGVYLYCELFAVRVAWNVDPERTTPLGNVLGVAQTLLLDNADLAKKLRFTNSGAGSAGRLQITYLYQF